jgi:hypothetical protein
VAYSLSANPVVSLESVRECDWVPGDVRDDDVFVCSVDNVGVHPKCQEAFPFPIFPIP